MENLPSINPKLLLRDYKCVTMAILFGASTLTGCAQKSTVMVKDSATPSTMPFLNSDSTPDRSLNRPIIRTVSQPAEFGKLETKARHLITKSPSSSQETPDTFNLAQMEITPPANLNPEIAKPAIVGSIENFVELGIPASVTLAQLILESDWGRMYPYGSNNLFGIKWPEGVIGKEGIDFVIAPTTEFRNGKWVRENDRFVRFETIEKGIKAHGNLLAFTTPYTRVQELINSSITDPFKFTWALLGVYATDPAYKDNLDRLIRDYNLAQFDQFVVTEKRPS